MLIRRIYHTRPQSGGKEKAIGFKRPVFCVQSVSQSIKSVSH